MTDKKKRGRPRNDILAIKDVAAVLTEQFNHDASVSMPISANGMVTIRRPERFKVSCPKDIQITPSETGVSVSAEATIHQVLGQMTDIITAPQESKRSGYKW